MWQRLGPPWTEAVRVAVQSTEDGCRAEPARGQRRGTLSALDANEIASHKNAHSAALQETNKAIHGIQMELSVQRFTMSDMRRQFPEHTQHSCRVSDGISVRSGADPMGARGEDTEPYRPTANPSSRSRHRAPDAVILECERLRQAVERCQSHKR